MGLRSLREQAQLVKERHGASLPYEAQHLLAMVEEEHTRAKDAYQYFEYEHPGKSFRVFDPDDIEMAFSDEVEPLDLQEHPPEEEEEGEG